MMSSSSVRADLRSRIYPEPEPYSWASSGGIDHFDRLPDSLLLLVFNRIGDVKALGRCCVVSRRFNSLAPQVENVVVRVDCVISDDEASSSAAGSSSSDKSHGGPLFSNLFRLVFYGGIVKPLQALGQFLGPKRSSSISDEDVDHPTTTTHHSPTQVLKNFNEIRFLRIELPSGELGIDDGVLLKWRADFGSTLRNCVILGASSVTTTTSPGPAKQHLLISQQQQQQQQVNNNGDGFCGGNAVGGGGGGDDDNGSIPESFYTNGGLKLRVVWTISSLIAASARHYLLQPIIAEHKTLDSLVLTDADGQGVLCMNKDQLEELRAKPLSASSASKRTLVPALNMRLWYAPHLELPDGTLLKGATLVAIRPSDEQSQSAYKEVVSDSASDESWVSAAFEEPYGMAAKMLVKRRTYCLEMNSF